MDRISKTLKGADPLKGADFSSIEWLIKKAQEDKTPIEHLKMGTVPLAIYLTQIQRLKTLQIFAELGLNLHALDHNDNNALHWAAERGALNLSKYLIQQGLSVHHNNKYGHQPMGCAAGGRKKTVNSAKIIALFLKEGANINHRSEVKGSRQHYTALEWAIDSCNINALSFLLQQPTLHLHNVNGKGQSALELSFRPEGFESFKCIVEQPQFSAQELQKKDQAGLTPFEKARKNHLLAHVAYFEGPGFALLEKSLIEASLTSSASSILNASHLSHTSDDGDTETSSPTRQKRRFSQKTL